MNVQQYFRGKKSVAAPPVGPAFISTWDTRNVSTGSSNSDQIRINLASGEPYTYDFTVDWGDGSTDHITAFDQAELTHTYSIEGIYTVSIAGTCIGFTFSGSNDRLKILDISQWGSIEFFNTNNSNSGVFRLCANLQVSATDNPILPVWAAGFFRQCSSLTGNTSFNNWDLTGCTIILEFFNACSSFNVPIGNWSFPLVTSLQGVLSACSAFNQNINTWVVDNITSLRSFLAGCTSYNQPMGNWNTGNVTDMVSTFLSCYVFNQPLPWDTSKVTAFGAGNAGMFYRAYAFNQPLPWDTGAATTMQQMFRNASSFRQDISNFNFEALTSSNSFEAFMLANTGWGTSNYDNFLNAITDQAIQLVGITNVSFNSINYSASATEARALLTRSNITVSVTNATDNGAGLVRLTTIAAHGLSTGNKIFVSGITGTIEANGGWIVTVIDASTIDLQSSTFANMFISGGTVRTGYGWTIADGGIAP